MRGSVQIPPRFGLLDDGEDRWSRFFDHIKGMNARADRFTSYKAFFIARHGEGFHNVAEAKYGTPAWNDVWSKLDGDGVLVWGPDAELTPNGEAQAAVARDAWRREREAGIPLPGRFYVSPLSRALRTLEITMRGLLSEHTVKPIVTENCREVYGVHTCDQRRSRAFIGATYPAFRIERGFAETDQLWTPDVRETDAHVAKRAREVLDSVFWGDEEGEMFISVTGHGGITNGFMAAVGRPSYSLPTGGILPIVVKSVFTPRGSRP
ncbi:histidine phosphatase superfamily [Lyophyllum atratum]|nr:histidine phosphatase superfamily [Lyophyllum atratum]